MTKKEEIDEKGWMLVKNVFTTAEINEFREYVDKEKSHKGDLLSSQLLKNALTDNRVLKILKECLGSENILYFGDSSVSINSTGNGFHKDSKDRYNKDSYEFNDKNYSLIRLGIYLQDHSKHSKGLCLRSKSHLHQSVSKGEIINVKSEIGDVVVWKLTTTHSANADVISLFPNHSFHPRIARRFPSFMKQESIDPRIALFMSFGLEDEYSSSFIEYLETRQYAINRWSNSSYSKEVIDEMEKKNVKIYRGFNIDNIDQDKVTVEHNK